MSSVKKDEKYYKKFMKVTKKGLILDLGCGRGKVSDYFTKFGYQCIGYDITESTIKKGKEIYPYLNLNVGNMISIPIQEKLATGAIYVYSLSSLTDEEALKSFISCNKNLEDEGKLYISVLAKKDREYITYVNAFDKEKLIFLLDLAGFKIDYLKYRDKEKSVVYLIASKYKCI